jgi:hypothetical protein
LENVIITALKRVAKKILEDNLEGKGKGKGKARMPTLGRQRARLTKTENEEMEARWAGICRRGGQRK